MKPCGAGALWRMRLFMPDMVIKLSALLGISFTSGINLYLTICMVGLAFKLDVGDKVGLEGLKALDSWPLIIICGVMFLIEFVADKLPAIDHVWNAIHSFIRPVAAAAIAVLVVTTNRDASSIEWILAGLGAAMVATTTNAAKVGSRVMLAASPEPFSDVILSLAGDGLVLIIVPLAIAYPVPTAIVCLVLLAVLAYLLPRFWRGMVFVLRISWHAIVAIFVRDSVADALADMGPEDADALAKVNLADKKADLVLQANVKGLRGAGWLRRGKLILIGSHAVFVYRKWFGWRVAKMPIETIAHARLRRRLLSNLLWIQTPKGGISFLTTRRTDRRTDHALELLGHAPAAEPSRDESRQIDLQSEA